MLIAALAAGARLSAAAAQRTRTLFFRTEAATAPLLVFASAVNRPQMHERAIRSIEGTTSSKLKFNTVSRRRAGRRLRAFALLATAWPRSVDLHATGRGPDPSPRP